MPYIKKDKRPAIDALLAPVIKYLQSLPEQEQDGVLNYSITKIIKNLPKLRWELGRKLLII